MLHKIQNRFHIDQIGNAYNQVLSKTFEFKGESHNFIEALYVVSGCVRITEDGKVYILNEGDIIVHAPMEFHCVKSYANTSPNIRNLSFTVAGDLPREIFEGVYHLNGEQMTRFVKCVDLAHRYETDRAKSGYLGQYVLCELSSFLIDICNESAVQEAVSNERSAKIYSQIVAAMQGAVYQNASLFDVAGGMGISVSYLKKLFMQYANTSPKTFYNALRAKEAAHLLEEGMAVSAIAEKMNFSSPNYFSLFFKKHFCCAPLEYKRSCT